MIQIFETIASVLRLWSPSACGSKAGAGVSSFERSSGMDVDWRDSADDISAELSASSITVVGYSGLLISSTLVRSEVLRGSLQVPIGQSKEQLIGHALFSEFSSDEARQEQESHSQHYSYDDQYDDEHYDRDHSYSERHQPSTVEEVVDQDEPYQER